jgi:SpoIIAA-like
MFKVIKTGKNRLDIEMSGKLDADSMTHALDDLVKNAQAIEQGKMLYTIIDFQRPTLGAIGIEFSRFPEMFGLMKNFTRAAVLTDKTWLKVVSKFEGALYPSVDIKTFNIDQKNQAEAWLEQ